MAEKKLCPECGKTVCGRKDKVFCCPECKNRYYNSKYSRNAKIKSQTAGILENNYSILELVLKSGLNSFEMKELKSLGFNPEYMTAHFRNAHGRMETRCYDISYSMTASKIFRLRRADISPEISL